MKELMASAASLAWRAGTMMEREMATPPPPPISCALPATVSAIFLKGDQSNGSGVVFGDGVRCAGGALVRMRLVANQAGAAEFPEAGDPPLSTATGLAVGSGTYAWYQVAYRNTAAAFCPPSTLNATNGVRILW